MKLVAIYNLFDGVELLEYAATQIRPHVDCIVVHYQDVNWYGNPSPVPVEPILKELKEKGVINDYFAFNGFSPVAKDWLQAKHWENIKRKNSKLWAINFGYTHYLECDVDEFYVSQQFQEAKELIEYDDYDTTSCDITTYILSPALMKTAKDDIKVPFICKTSLIMPPNNTFPVRIDHTRMTAGVSKKHHHFEPEALVMHHMETVRKDLNLKYASTSRGNLDRTKIPRLIELIQKADEGKPINLEGIISPSSFSVIKTKNLFNIPEFSLNTTEK